jgi:hypothetical protein
MFSKRTLGGATALLKNSRHGVLLTKWTSVYKSKQVNKKSFKKYKKVNKSKQK